MGSYRTRSVEKIDNGHVVRDHHVVDGKVMKNATYFTPDAPPAEISDDLGAINGPPAPKESPQSSLARAMRHIGDAA
jgi:hypothetical protein